jgi:DNA processing protein
MIRKICKEDKIYPQRLSDHLSDPKDIYYTGNIGLLDGPTLGIVGSRKCTSYGLGIAGRLAEEASSRGVTVISGLARGIDTAAHLGTKNHSLRTVGVLANGVDVFYPSENRSLQLEIGEKGLLVSEYENGTKPRTFHFPARNRIIAALSDVLVVVEAGSRSGALITAEAAIEQGKEVLAIPGNITSKASLGTNKLIADGALPLVRIEDAFIKLGVKAEVEDERLNKLGSLERLIIMTIGEESGEISVASLREKTGLSSSNINALISILEMKGFVVYEMGKVFLTE